MNAQPEVNGLARLANRMQIVGVDELDEEIHQSIDFGDRQDQSYQKPEPD
jgi:hypothetical protein